MIARIIRWSLQQRLLVLLSTLLLSAWGLWSLQQTPLDALPDLSDPQVIIRTSYPGQAPQLVEQQRANGNRRHKGKEQSHGNVCIVARRDERKTGFA